MPKRTLKKKHNFPHNRFPFSRIRARLKRVHNNHQKLVQSMLAKKKEGRKKSEAIASFDMEEDQMSYADNASTRFV